MYVFIGLRGSPRENKLPNYNIWHIPLESDGDYDVDAACRRAHADPELEKPLAFISFPSSRDPTWEKRFPGISTAIVIGEGKWEWYEQFKEQRPGHREEAYQQAKRRFAERAKAVLLRYCPQLKDKIEYVDVGTPLSNANYIAAPFGESYGLAPTRERFLDYEHLRPDTSVKGLFMTGQDISTSEDAARGMQRAHAHSRAPAQTA
jgi:all-trans-retinol 13,14-reductase